MALLDVLCANKIPQVDGMGILLFLSRGITSMSALSVT